MAFDTLSELVDQALTLLQASSPDGGPDRAHVQAQAQGAVKWISRFAPRVYRDTVSGDGSSYKIALPSTWVSDFSILQQVEYPIQTAPRYFLKIPEDVTLWPSIGGATHLYFTSPPESGSSNVALDFTVIHTVSDSTSTIPSHLEEVVENLLASIAAKLWAARHGNTGDSTLNVDAVNYRGKGSEWAAISKALLETASQIYGADLSGTSWSGSGRLQQWM